ncbi:hypothetical protein GCM10010335_37290 [Streptomyces galbus]|uniref:Uncharacterized protein n=1 Tax=Streptomyces galbus TaxID=33898 RepID=A0A4U5X7J0_STRGB|nr:hypothetical protein E4U92_01440 [Streptomyces galbus]GHD38490.1 hypothetical protein GCM10010335_37290 [Streptomyces galbus]
MLNRIRRAFTLTRGRHVSRGRHRRAVVPPRSPVTPASRASADAPTVALRRPFDGGGHRYGLAGEDNALIRPYMLAGERRTRRHPAVVVAPYLPANARSLLLGVR